MTIAQSNIQIPDKSIYDKFNRQVYLGNEFAANLSATSITTTSELALFYFRNDTSLTAMFLRSKKLSAVTASASATAFLSFYLNPTLTIGAQTIALGPDVSGSLNSTYFLLNTTGSQKYYVWYNINSAGVDPAIAGRTGIAVAGATNATAATLGAATVTAINSAASAWFTATGTATVTLTNASQGNFTGASDGTAATGFTFAVTSASYGTVITPLNQRSKSATVSQMGAFKNPTVSANGTFLSSIAANPFVTFIDESLYVVEPGSQLLVTVTAGANPTKIIPELKWYEI